MIKTSRATLFYEIHSDFFLISPARASCSAAILRQQLLAEKTFYTAIARLLARVMKRATLVSNKCRSTG